MMCKNKVTLFDEPKRNRRFTPAEYEQEVEEAKIWRRVPRSFILDRPTYPWVPQNTKHMVNFDLNPPLYGI